MIVCCGEALIDMVPATTNRGEAACLPCPGGSPYNSAIALGRLGRAPGFLGALSRDFFGTMLEDRLIANAVSTDYIRRVARPSTLAFVKLEPGKDPEYAFYMEGSADRGLSPQDLSPLPDSARCILAGSISLALEPCGSTIEAMLTQESGNRVFSFDPNIRSSMIHDRARYMERLARLLGLATIVKISEVDLAWIYPGMETDPAFDALCKLALENRPADRPFLAVVTKGPDGARAYLKRKQGELDLTAPGFSVKVSDTIGAGDTFHAGFLAWLEAAGSLSISGLDNLDEQSLWKAVRFANACAAITCSRRGAEPPAALDVFAFLQEHGASEADLPGTPSSI